LQIKTKIISSYTADSKPVKQEVNGTVILPPLVFPGPGSACLLSLFCILQSLCYTLTPVSKKHIELSCSMVHFQRRLQIRRLQKRNAKMHFKIARVNNAWNEEFFEQVKCYRTFYDHIFFVCDWLQCLFLTIFKTYSNICGRTAYPGREVLSGVSLE
jgi:hypothetical protein